MPEVKSIIIKKVNNERQPKKRIKCGSLPIYSTEYKWTKKDIVITTNSIVAETLSYKNIQWALRSSIRNQSKNKSTTQKVWYKHTSVNIIKIDIKLKRKQKKNIKKLPFEPKKRPKQNKKSDEKKGKKIKLKNIYPYYNILLLLIY